MKDWLADANSLQIVIVAVEVFILGFQVGLLTYVILNRRRP